MNKIIARLLLLFIFELVVNSFIVIFVVQVNPTAGLVCLLVSWAIGIVLFL